MVVMLREKTLLTLNGGNSFTILVLLLMKVRQTEKLLKG